MTPIEETTSADPADLAQVNAGMREAETALFPGLPPESEDVHYFACVRRSDSTVAAGIVANVFWDGVEIEMLWVAPDQRSAGVGSRLLGAAEEFARGRGAVVAYLKTVDAAPFYAKRGYQIYGTLEDRPIGSQLHHMKKRLD